MWKQLAFIPLTAALYGAPASIGKLDLFEAGKDGYALYRIPGIVVTPKGTLLAYCEARKTERGDWGTIDILMRRSADGGKTWSVAKRIAEVEGPKHKNPVALAQKLAASTDVTYNNPVAIPDQKTGSVHFVFNLEYMRAFYMRSDDDGQTWSKPAEITSAFEKFRPEYDWKVLATGPGHGIQLRNGRLIIPIWLSTGTGGHAHRPSVSSVVYSDDHGKTWNRGDIAVPNTPGWVFPSETAAVELASGGVLLNVRSESKAHRRLQVRSKDGATGWSRPEFHSQLVEPICMAGMVRLGHRILFSNPDNLERAEGKVEEGKTRDRRNVSVQVSYDEGRTFSVKKVIEPEWSGYSDLATAPDGTVYLFFERGLRTRALTLARFNLEWLTDGKDSFQTPAPRVPSITWTDVRQSNVEGQGWRDTKAPFDRFPAKSETVIRTPVWNLSRDSTGLRVRFATDSAAIHATWTLNKQTLALPHMPATGVSGLDLYVRHEGKWRWLANGRPTARTNTQALIQNWSGARREYMLYFPLYNGLESLSIGVPDGAKLEFLPHESAKPVVFYGTSIAQGGCASRPGMVYSSIVGRMLDWPTINLGFSGNALSEPEISQLLVELDPAVYVYDSLPNLSLAFVKERTEPFLRTLRKARPTTPIVLVENVIYTNSEVTPSRGASAREKNAVLKSIFEKLKGEGDKRLYYVPADNLLGTDGEGTVDGTHPTDLGFLRMAETIAPVIRPLLR